jgi:plasmid maintenance system antidote protein VapI
MINPLKRYLIDREISQTTFAEELGTTKMRVSQLCSKGPGTFLSAERLQDLTGIPIEAWIHWRRSASAPGSSQAKRKGSKR